MCLVVVVMAWVSMLGGLLFLLYWNSRSVKEGAPPVVSRSPLDAPYRCGWCYVTRVYRNPLLFDLSLLGRMESTPHAPRHPDVFFVVLDGPDLTLYLDEMQAEAALRLDMPKVSVNIHPAGLYRDEVMIPDYPIALSRDESNLFFLYAANGMEKEDWFLALRHASRGSLPIPPDWSEFAASLAHSHDWISAMAARILYQVHRSGDLVSNIQARFQRRLSHVHLPSLLGPIHLRQMNLSPRIPRLTDGRWHGVGHGGEMNVSFDIHYEGEISLTVDTEVTCWPSVRVPISAIITVKSLQGRMMLKLKPPPSDRLWFAFYAPPHLDLTIEPVVAYRAISWTTLQRIILTRVHAAIAEYIVLPHMDELLVLPCLQIGQQQWAEEPYLNEPIPPCFEPEPKLSKAQSSPLSAPNPHLSSPMLAKQLLQASSTLNLTTLSEPALEESFIVRSTSPRHCR